MTFKDNAAKENFRKFYKLNAAEHFMEISVSVSLAEDMEQLQEKSFDKLAEIFDKSTAKLCATRGVIIAQIDKILDILREYWAYGNIIPAK